MHSSGRLTTHASSSLALIALGTVLNPSVAFAFPEVCYVSPHVAELREAPRDDAQVVDLMPVNTPLRAIETKGIWRLVPAGWIKAEECSPEPQVLRPIGTVLNRSKRARQRILALKKWQALSSKNVNSARVRSGRSAAYKAMRAAFDEADLPASCVLNVDIANLRARPSPDAPIARYAPINSLFVPHDRDGPWLRVDGGWLHRSLCAQERLTAEAAKEAAEKAPDRSEKINWLQRRVAIEPHKKDAWQALSQAMLESDAVDASDVVKQKLNGKTYVAQCRRGILWVQGVVEASGEFRRLMWANNPDQWGIGSEYDDVKHKKARIRHEALRLKDDLAKTNWFATVDGAAPRFAGAARLWPPADLKPSVVGEIVDVTADDTFWSGIALGSCRDEQRSNLTYATSPTQPAAMKACPASVFQRVFSREIDAYSKANPGAEIIGVQKAYCQHDAASKLTDFGLISGPADYETKFGRHMVQLGESRVVKAWAPGLGASVYGPQGSGWVTAVWNPTQTFKVVGFEAGMVYGRAIFVVHEDKVKEYILWKLLGGC